ncbi:hypothetical protein PHYSODRAFT_329015 [Phytophthora sojae]|uniref:Uncharacterized protein n=1 Tax=Phytophthora sojae (strain P6497) TaxID=1094619 RepID=G4Z650_PHYSP|nr:hypothetical protein PHYSODRAFT_329015 [Phytophthora sojae]EGZ20971.1 hypothetical protein PHYSODRAFT_329015 [Phytophthora sojae]|eukprot:XP_009523688.1 hypothetical protein PHYSODRAFT_329015 [Phytophthora sojae]
MKKLDTLDHQYGWAFKWLQQNEISIDDALNGSIDGEVQAKVKAKFPLYRELLSVLRPYFKPGNNAATESTTRVGQTKGKRKAADQDNQNTSKRRRRARASAAPVAAPPASHDAEAETETPVATTARVQPPSVTYKYQQMNVASSMNWFYNQSDEMLLQPSEHGTQETKKRLGNAKVEHIRQLSDLRLESQKLRVEAQRVTTMQNLVKEGIPDEAIQRHISSQRQ